jgi:hypothetical protein
VTYESTSRRSAPDANQTQAAVALTCDHIGETALVPLQVASYKCEWFQDEATIENNDQPIQLVYVFDVIPGAGATTTADDLDNAITAAFELPPVFDLLFDLANLPADNPFTVTTALTVVTQAVP